MKRREFMTAAGLAGLAPLGSLALADDGCEGAKKDIYELRVYHFASAAKQDAFDAFLKEAAIPALNRIGIGPVGAFTPAEGDANETYVLLPHKSLESVVGVVNRLGQDDAFLAAGAALLDAPIKDAAYERFESSLLIAFDGMPKLARPSDKDTRVFQLRIYESHSIRKGQKKIEMFNTGGELEIFARAGLTPVFFGEAVVGSRLPNLTYMLGFDDMQSGEKAWAAFRADPGWQELKSDPQYKDTVSKITNLFLRPGASSQI